KTQESAGATSAPRSTQQAQGEASAPPQEKTPPAPAQPAQPSDGAEGNGGQLRSSPLARRLASERGLDLSRVQGSGPGGRIIKRDIEYTASVAASAPAARPTMRAPSGADYADVALTQIRKTIAKRLAESI